MTDHGTHAPGRCRSLLEELSQYVEGDLSAAKCRALERHLAQCPCCGELADNLRKAIWMCQAEGRRRLPAAVRARARARIADLLGPARPSSRKTPPAAGRGPATAATRKRAAAKTS